MKDEGFYNREHCVSGCMHVAAECVCVYMSVHVHLHKSSSVCHGVCVVERACVLEKQDERCVC